GAANRGVEIHYIEGNHDFMIRRAFARVRGMKVHTSEVTLERGDKRFYVAHGDLADREDYGYRALRVLFRSPAMKAFVKFAPGSWVDGFGQFSSHRSRSAKPRLPSEYPIERRERLRKVYRSFAAQKIAEGFDYVVMGHCHDLDEMEFTV